MECYRRKMPGARFSEGARQLWLKMAELKLTQSQVARTLAVDTSRLSKVLYGERGSGGWFALACKEHFDIDPKLFKQPPAEAFVPPALQQQEVGS